MSGFCLVPAQALQPGQGSSCPAGSLSLLLTGCLHSGQPCTEAKAQLPRAACSTPISHFTGHPSSPSASGPFFLHPVRSAGRICFPTQAPFRVQFQRHLFHDPFQTPQVHGTHRSLSVPRTFCLDLSLWPTEHPDQMLTWTLTAMVGGFIPQFHAMETQSPNPVLMLFGGEPSGNDQAQRALSSRLD